MARPAHGVEILERKFDMRKRWGLRKEYERRADASSFRCLPVSTLEESVSRFSFYLLDSQPLISHFTHSNLLFHLSPTRMAAAAPKSEMEQDVGDWMNRINATAKDHSGITNPTGSVPWSAAFFGCFDPIDTCAITCCCPCITFGKTHHRLRKDANLVGYNVVNASVCDPLV